jgi:hypothetical protein
LANIHGLSFLLLHNHRAMRDRKAVSVRFGGSAKVSFLIVHMASCWYASIKRQTGTEYESL